MAERELTTRLGANTSGFKSGVSEVVKQLDKLNKSLISNQSEVKATNKELTALQKEQAKLKAEMDKTNGGTEEQKKRYQELTQQIDSTTLKLAELKTNQDVLKSQVANTSSELKNQTTELVASKEAMSKVQSNGKELATTLGVLSAAITASVGALTAFVHSEGAWADDLNTLSKVTNISTSDLQKFQYATDLIDVSVSTLSGSLRKLTNNMQTASEGGTSSAVKAFDALGVSVTDSEGQLRNTQDTFYEIIDALGKVSNETERDALSMDIFGKSATELNPLIQGGAEQLKQLGSEAENLGLILSQDKLDKLNAVNDRFDTLKAKFNQVKAITAEEMTPAVEGLVEVADNLLMEVKEMADSGELSQKAQELKAIIKSLADTVKNLIDFLWKYKEVIVSAVSAMVAFKVALSIGNFVSSLVVAVKNLTTAIKAGEVATLGFNAALNTNPIVLAISALAALTVGLINYANSASTATEETENYSSALENAKSISESTIASAESEAKTIESLKEKYDELRNKTNFTTSEKQELDNVTQNLAKTLGISVDKIKSQSGAYKDLTKEVNDYITSLKSAAEAEATKNLYTSAVEEKLKAEREIKEYKQKWQAFKDEVNADSSVSGTDANKWLSSKYRDRYNELQKEGKSISKKYEEAESAVKDYGNMLSKTAKNTNELGNATEDENERLEEQENLTKAVTDSYDEMLKTQNLYNTAQKEWNDNGYISLNTLNSLQKQYPDLIELVNDYINKRASEKDIIDALKKQYSNDVQNYQNALQAKTGKANEYYNKAMSQNQELVNWYKKQYDIDVTNFASAEAAKAEIRKKAWEQFSTQYTVGYENGQQYLMVKKANGEYERTTDLSALNQYRNAGSDIDAAVNRYLSSGLYSSGYSSGSGGSSGSSGGSSGNNSGVTWTTSGSGESYSASTKLEAQMGWMSRMVSMGKMDEQAQINYLNSILRTEQLTVEERYKVRQELYNLTKKLQNEEISQAKEAYNKLVSDQTEAINKEKTALQDRYQKEIDAINKLKEKRDQLNSDKNRQAEIDKINAQLQYQQLDELSRRELLRKKQNLINEQNEVNYERSLEAQKEQITARYNAQNSQLDNALTALQQAANSAASYFDQLSGNKNSSQVINNNSTNANIRIIQNALSDQQMVNKLINALYRK